MNQLLNLPDYTRHEESIPLSTTMRKDEVSFIDQLVKLLNHTDGPSVFYASDRHTRSGMTRLLLRFAFLHQVEFLTWYRKEVQGKSIWQGNWGRIAFVYEAKEELMATWEGFYAEEVNDLSPGVELMAIPKTDGQYGYGQFSNMGLQFIEPLKFSYLPGTKLDFDRYQYLVRISWVTSCFINGRPDPSDSGCGFLSSVWSLGAQ
jgi:hypothetical protein